MNETAKLNKLARNETIKLAADWANNVSVGLLLGGFFIPFFALYRSLPDLGSWVDDVVAGRAVVSLRHILIVVAMFVAFGLATYGSHMCRNAAFKFIEKLEE